MITLSHRQLLHVSNTYLNCLISAYNVVLLHFRPPDIVVGGLKFTAILLLSSSFLSAILSELAEHNSTKTGHMLQSECDLKMHVQNLGYPLSLKFGSPQTTFFRRLRNLTAALTAYIFGTEHDVDNRARALKTARGRLHVPYVHELWSTNG